MKTSTKEMILYLQSLNIGIHGTDWIEMDNLDKAKLVDYYGEVKVENEHGTIYDLEDLSEEELKIFWEDN